MALRSFPPVSNNNRPNVRLDVSAINLHKMRVDESMSPSHPIQPCEGWSSRPFKVSTRLGQIPASVKRTVDHRGHDPGFYLGALRTATPLMVQDHSATSILKIQGVVIAPWSPGRQEARRSGPTPLHHLNRHHFFRDLDIISNNTTINVVRAQANIPVPTAARKGKAGQKSRTAVPG